MRQDHADVVATAAEDGEYGIPGGPVERTSRQAAVILDVTDHRLNGATLSQELRNRAGNSVQLPLYVAQHTPGERVKIMGRGTGESA